MGRAFGFVVLVAALWIAMEFYANGIEGAFGGVLETRDGVRESRSIERTERAVDAFQRAYDESTQRVDRVVGD